MILNVILAIGFILGSRLFANYNYWPVIYIISNVLAIIYIILTSNLFRESFKLTINFRNTLKSYLFLILSGFIGNLTTYLDKIIIYPVLGAASVSVFSVASFLGKSLALVVTPVTSVFLSYLCNNSFSMTKKLYKILNVVFLALAIMVFLGCLLFQKQITSFLYPTVYEKAESYILIANFASILGILSSFNGTITLKYAPSYWQVIISTIKITLYILLSIILMSKYELYGFAIALIITNSFNIILNFFVGYIYLGKNQGVKNV